MRRSSKSRIKSRGSASSWPTPPSSRRWRAFRRPIETTTRADDLAVFQYTSGTTRELPAAVKHTHRAIVTLMFAALYGTGIRPGDEFFCPSSPAWGHGLWHGTLAPLALGVTTGTFAGRFDAGAADEGAAGLRDHEHVGGRHPLPDDEELRQRPSDFAFSIKKLSYTGEPIDPATLEFIDQTFHVPACSMYGTTEIGVVLVNYPGAERLRRQAGLAGQAGAGPEARGAERRTDRRRNRGWSASSWCGGATGGRRPRTSAKIDEDGYFYHAGRADDVIISAGWTMSAVEIENTLLKHPDVREAAVIGVPDATRGQVVKAFIVSDRSAGDDYRR